MPLPEELFDQLFNGTEPQSYAQKVEIFKRILPDHPVPMETIISCVRESGIELPVRITEKQRNSLIETMIRCRQHSTAESVDPQTADEQTTREWLGYIISILYLASEVGMHDSTPDAKE